MDAICAVKILQCILRFDNIVYVLVPVKTVTELIKAFEEQKVDVRTSVFLLFMLILFSIFKYYIFFQVKHVVLINCGGTLDIIEVLEPEEDITFFVVDSHRPTDICNIYSSSQVFYFLYIEFSFYKYLVISKLCFVFQVRVLIPPDDEEKIPDFEDIFNENEVIIYNIYIIRALLTPFIYKFSHQMKMLIPMK